MIIDFHTHIFPNKIATGALSKLSSIINVPPSMNGTVQGLLNSMAAANIDTSIILPVVTDPHQFDSIFRFAAQINEHQDNSNPQLISFAGIHPDMDNYKALLHKIASHGFLGIKLHPNYQGVNFDDIRYMRIIYTASELGLIIQVHTGIDPYTPGKLYCSPDMILRVIKETAAPKLVLAHMGNNKNYDEAEAKLCGQDVYFDTAYSIKHMSPEQLVRMIHHHGSDKILFGSDAPWTSQKADVEKLRSITDLSPTEKQQIFYQNAQRLLGR